MAAVQPLAAGFAQAFTDAITTLYKLGLVVVALGLVASLLIPDVPLRRQHDEVPHAPLE